MPGPRYKRQLSQLHLPSELEIHERILAWEELGFDQASRAAEVARQKVRIADIPAHRKELEYWRHAVAWCKTRLQKVRQRIATLQRAGAVRQAQ